MDILEINPNDLSPFKLALISFGSLCGIGVGLIASILITSTLIKMIIAAVLLTIGLSSIFKSIKLMV